jgi:hypothetical protein
LIIRVARRRRYAVIDRAALNDPQISFKAKGILAYLLDKKDDWNIDRDALAEVGPDGVTAIRSGLKELTEAGYLRRQTVRQDNGRLVTESWLYETPPEDGNPPAVPVAENPPAVEDAAGGAKTDQRLNRPAVNPPANRTKTITESLFNCPNNFAAFWEQYPPRSGKKLGQPEAENAWHRMTEAEREIALRGVVHYRAACSQQLAIAKDAHNWLSKKAYLDWQTPARPDPKPGEIGVPRFPVYTPEDLAHIESLAADETPGTSRTEDEVTRAQQLRKQLTPGPPEEQERRRRLEHVTG